jgi:hypothetical protein
VPALLPEENSVRSRLFSLSTVFRALLAPAAGCALLLLAVSACGTGGAAAASSASPSPGASAYFACLQQHGAIPTARPTARPTAFPSGGFGAANPAMQKAREACASLRPAGGIGGFGGFGGRFGQAIQAFRTCMADHGEAVPTTRPTAPPTPAPSPGTDRFLNGLNPSNPKVAAALKACQSKLPSFPGATG